MPTLEEMNRALVEHYAKMAMQEGWIDYARHRVKEMQDDKSGNWVDLGRQVKDRMDELKNDH
jgi:uncharacterized coiled-coil protein SlyX